ncbi:MAG: PQQ-dependent sugar dehydrogenase [Gammaproteobacteria bacterium]|nr:PQQ-dependent sugar dehydrogenase [Gammaproteobacteria bacterium]
MYPIPDNSGRLVLNDLRGLLYFTDKSGTEPVVYLDLREQEVGFDDSMFPNETGLTGFAFHPGFGDANSPGYGKFYTAFSVDSGSGVSDYLEMDADSHESVVWEWTANTASANQFAGRKRELFRIGQFANNHNIGTLAFNPAATPGSSDYGLLYLSLGDGGGANDPAEYGQSLNVPMASILRIDPLGGATTEAYGIPADNPFINVSNAAPEIWAYGLRHAQHFSFDVDGTMYINDIGQAQIEEVNIGKAGANYGWRVREGTFATAFGIGGVRPNPVYPPPTDMQAYEYPVAQYDHDEGSAISSGFVYRGTEIPALEGKYVFSDLVSGRIFYIETAFLIPGQPAPITELRLMMNGVEVNLAEAVGFPNTYGRGKRAGLRLGIDAAGELYLLTKGDGWVRRLRSVKEGSIELQ